MALLYLHDLDSNRINEAQRSIGGKSGIDEVAQQEAA